MDWLSENWLSLLLLVGVLLFMMRRGRMGCGHGGHASHGLPPRDEMPPVDPVSGERVAQDSAFVAMHRGRLYRFASRENRDRFENGPERFVDEASGSHAGRHRHGRHGGC